MSTSVPDRRTFATKPLSFVSRAGDEHAARVRLHSAVALVCIALLGVCALSACTQPPGDAEPGSTAGRTPAVPLLEDQRLDELEPGPYAFTPDDDAAGGLMPVLTVPEGYVSLGSEGFGIESTGDVEGRYHVLWLWHLEEIYDDPCGPVAGLRPVGPEVGDIAAALAAQPLRDGSEPVPITIGGYDGFYVELTVPDDMDVDACPTGRFNSWPGRWMQEGGQVSMVWILDVDGQQITFEGSYGPSADPRKVAEIRTMVETATFVPRPGT